MELEPLPAPAFLGKIVTLACVTAGLLAIAMAWSVPVTHTRGGGFTLEGWWTGIFGAVIVLVSLAWWSRWRLAGMLSGVYILGMSAQLALFSPHFLMYFRLRSLDGKLDYLSVGIFLIQLVVVGIFIFPHIRKIVYAARELINPLRLLVIGLVFAACAVQFNLHYPEIFEHKWALRTYLEQLLAAAGFVTINLLNLLVVAMAAPVADLKRLNKWAGARFSIPGRDARAGKYDRIFPWLLALFTFTVSGFFSLYVFDASPHIPDDAMYLFQARVLSTGSTSVPAPPVPEAFDLYMLVVEDDKWYSVNIPGWTALLSLGVLLGIPWLLNPLIGALSIPVAHAIIRRVADYGTANLVALLLATSPWVIYLSASLQPQPSSLLFCLLSMLCLLRATELHSWKFALLGGVAAGIIFCIRPLDGLLCGIAAGIYMLFTRSDRLFSRLVGYGAGCVITGSLLLAYNFYETGSLLEMTYENYFDRIWSPGANSLGFGPEVGKVWGIYDKIPGHGWRDVLVNLNQNLFNLNTELLGWCIGSLFPVVIYLLFSRWSAADRFSLLVICLFMAGFSLYWFSGGAAYGPRYWYLMIVPVIFLGAQGLIKLSELFDQLFPGQLAPSRVSLIVAVLLLSSLFVFDSWRAVAKFKNFWGNNDRYLQLVEQGVFGKDGLVLVDSSASASYTSAFYLNDITPRRTGPVFVRYGDGQFTGQLLKAYPDRQVFHIRDSWTPDGDWLQVSKYNRDEHRFVPLDIQDAGRDE